jgi:hypothetical protein
MSDSFIGVMLNWSSKHTRTATMPAVPAQGSRNKTRSQANQGQV